MTASELIELVKTKYKPEEVAVIESAIDFASKAHSEQLRESGEPYIIHPLEVGKILFDLDLDSATVAAGLLHDVIEDNADVTVKEVSKLFGKEIAVMVDGVTKLTRTDLSDRVTKEEAQAENLRKMFLAIAQDLRVVIIKLADRLHNMRTLNFCERSKQIRKSKETLDVYAPLAHRFGMGVIKCELEDLALMYLYPEEYKKLKNAIEPQQMERMELLETAKVRIKKELADIGIDAQINGRPKHLYSIYRKIVKQGVTLDEIYDLTAIRVIVGSVRECYTALGIVHSLWRPLPGRFKDYIALPKPNMYQSIHTTLFSENFLPFEVQIRTLEMHQRAEFGIAAHWMYKEGRAAPDALDNKIAWLRQALEYQDDAQSTREFIDNVRKDFFSEYVFAVTPNGQIIDLPMGSTPIDFAYRIHTSIGHKLIRAKVNGSLVRLDYKLQSNDVVEIVTGPQENPNRSWIDIVKTQQAKTKIRQWFKKANREENIARGREMLADTAKRQGRQLSDFIEPDYYADIMKKKNFSKVDDVMAAIGYGGMQSTTVFHSVMKFYLDDIRKQEKQEQLPDIVEKKLVKPVSTRGVIVKGEPTMSVHFATCCSPLPGDKIFGYITRGRGVSVHRHDCPNAEDLLSHVERIIDVEWVKNEAETYPVSIRIDCEGRVGLIADVSQLFVKNNINLSAFNTRTEKNSHRISCSFYIKNSEQLASIMESLRQIDGVYDILRLSM